MSDLAKFLQDRNKAVVGSLDEFIAWAKTQGTEFSSREVAEISYHKCRTAILALGKDVRHSSHEWLICRGYESWL